MKINSLILFASSIVTAVTGLVLSTWVEPFNVAHVSSYSMTLTIQGETMLWPFRHLGSALILLGSILFTFGFISSYFRVHTDTEKLPTRELEINVIPLGEIPVPTV